MIHELGTCLWFDKNAKEAADFYKNTFSEFELISENPLAINYRMYGRRFMHLNGGPGYPINPSISFFVNINEDTEIERIWDTLTKEGSILMPLNTYPWSEKYGWCADKYGANWQIMKGHNSLEKIAPSLMFTGINNGKAAEAIEFYTKLFPSSEILTKQFYEKGKLDIEGNIKYAQFTLNGQVFHAMESSMPEVHPFNEGVSFIITVDNQEEIDQYWDCLIQEGQAGRCGWLKDKFGVSWQIVPSNLGRFMSNPETAPKATYAFLQMSKFVIADLEKAIQN
jgi:predicted 3-demethylubiquinone-9 3-methyltransferase (glyoxalase superfamily)